VVTAAIIISVEVLMMGNHFLGEKVCPEKIGVTGIIGLLHDKLGCNGIRVLILKCWMRMEIGSGLSVSNLFWLEGLFSPAYLSLE
jgi:hypothetical protein